MRHIKFRFVCSKFRCVASSYQGFGKSIWCNKTSLLDNLKPETMRRLARFLLKSADWIEKGSKEEAMTTPAKQMEDILERALKLLSEYYVEDHLFVQHSQLDKESLDERTRDLLNDAGVYGNGEVYGSKNYRESK